MSEDAPFFLEESPVLKQIIQRGLSPLMCEIKVLESTAQNGVIHYTEVVRAPKLQELSITRKEFAELSMDDVARAGVDNHGRPAIAVVRAKTIGGGDHGTVTLFFLPQIT